MPPQQVKRPPSAPTLRSLPRRSATREGVAFCCVRSRGPTQKSRTDPLFESALSGFRPTFHQSPAGRYSATRAHRDSESHQRVDVRCAGASLRRVHAAARKSTALCRLRSVLDRNSRPVSPVLRCLRRSRAHVAFGGRRLPLRSVPGAAAAHRRRNGDRRLCGTVARDRARVQVRRPPLDRVTLERLAAAPWCSDSRRRGSRRSGPAALEPPVAARLQPGSRTGGGARPSSRRSAQAEAIHMLADRTLGRGTARQRSRRLRPCQAARTSHGPLHRPCGRREHDRGDAGGVCPRVDGRRSARGANAYSSPSRDRTVSRTSALTTALSRSPGMRIQPGSDDCA